MLKSFDNLLATIPEWILLPVGVILLVLGGNWLVGGAVALARRLGISTLIIGLTVVAMGTSAPELVFNVIASSRGNGDLSFGNVVGSNIANIGLVLASGALFAPLVVHSRVVTRELPWLIVVTAGMCALPIVLRWLQIGAKGEAYHWVSGITFMAMFFITLFSWIRMARRDQKDPITAEMEQEASNLGKGRSAIWAIIMLLLGLSALAVGARATEEGAVQIAVSLGLTQTVIGLTIVAIATSLPELATTVVACKHRHTDLAVGNIIGSNLFNIGLVLGITTLIAPVPIPAWPRGVFDLTFMLILTVVLAIVAMTGRRISRKEGAILLFLYTAYMAARVIAVYISGAD